MGRGRQKAKQTKVARELKYYSPSTNYHQLEAELQGNTGRVATQERPASSSFDDDDDDFDYEALYGKYAAVDDEDDE
ncbi:MAG: DUF3073 domain-containing protein [Cellulomonadaceae bacterium]|jgi:hypothetical protein|nr:DUF3073 domain-containing protein [Cellulomonadaceae bacterium]